MTTAEQQRLEQVHDDIHGWRRWGPYVSDRAWGTVREDYSADGNAWAFLPHDLARSKAYRWGEDAIAGICDRYQLLVFAPAFWNGRDPILKERLFGLTPHEGNHGEDVKEYYFHEENLPSHAYMRFLYKYPQAEFPYRQLVDENRRRGGTGPEYELLDTGVFDESRYFDIVVEYAKAMPEDLFIRIEATNRGPEPARLHILPHLWFRNTWAWGQDVGTTPAIFPGLEHVDSPSIVADYSRTTLPPHIPVAYDLGVRFLYYQREHLVEVLYTDNETNGPRIFGPNHTSRSRFVKDAFHRRVVHGEFCTNLGHAGSKAAVWYYWRAVPPGGSVQVNLRLADGPVRGESLSARDRDRVFVHRRREADQFYETLHPPGATPDERLIQRRALAGLLWTKQSYLFDVDVWQDGDFPALPPPAGRKAIRNEHWRHLNSMRVMTVPDKWEYPWFAAWDLAFQCVSLALVDPAYAKNQLWALLFEQFQHPNGQLPAYEWEFSDLNPPVHAWAVWRVYHMDRQRTGRPDRGFLERCFHKLLINFAWWVNKVDRQGNNVFEGGFLGLDNITVVDRSVPCGDGGVLLQADATGWMGMFCLNLMRIALELAKENRVYEGMASKFFQHYVYVAHAMKHMGGADEPLWDERDGFFYDVLRYPDGRSRKFRVRSMVGLIPLFAVERLESEWLGPFPDFAANLDWFLKNRRELTADVVHTRTHDGKTTHALTIVNRNQLVRLLQRVWDPDEFLSDYGVRSLSRYHQGHPFVFDGRSVGYEPAEAESKIKGGNSNWRGPIWFPVGYLLVESLRKLGQAYGDDFRVPLPAGPRTFRDLARDLADRLLRIFTRDATGRRPVFGACARFQTDPHWRDHLLFYEYFHGNTGQGLGASHQTGWTALVANLIDEWRTSPDS